MKILFRPKAPQGTTFFCFTPLVSLSTFIIEFIFAVFVLIKYKPTLFSRLCALTLLCLGLFQLSEFLLCTTPFVNESIILGYVAITLLPALGMHIIYTLTKRWKIVTYLAYAWATILVIAIIFIPSIAFLATCNPNYVSYSANPFFSFFHWLYYVVVMMLGVSLLTYSLFKKIGDKKAEIWMIISYFVFIIPSLILVYTNVISQTALPSVMCGFALITAVIFVFVIIPRYYKLKRKK